MTRLRLAGDPWLYAELSIFALCPLIVLKKAQTSILASKLFYVFKENKLWNSVILSYYHYQYARWYEEDSTKMFFFSLDLIQGYLVLSAYHWLCPWLSRKKRSWWAIILICNSCFGTSFQFFPIWHNFFCKSPVLSIRFSSSLLIFWPVTWAFLFFNFYMIYGLIA